MPPIPAHIAAIIVEPIVGNAGCIPPAAGYLAGLRALTARHGALLIVDEVMTGFRVALGGACQLYALDPDLVTLGKIVGGGLPVGVFGGKRAFMDQLAPLGPVYQAGTLSGNPLAMAAGIATISYLQEHAAEVYPQLEATSKAVAEGVAAEAASAGTSLTTNRVGSMWTWFFTSGPVTNYDQAAKSDTAAFGRFHRAMLEQGIWLPPSQFEAAFLSTAHGDADIEATIAAARDCLCLLIGYSCSHHASTVTNRWLFGSARSAVQRPSRLARGSRPHPDARRRGARCSPRGHAAHARRSSSSAVPQSAPLKARSNPRSSRSTAPASCPSRAQCETPPAAAPQRAAGKTLPARP